MPGRKLVLLGLCAAFLLSGCGVQGEDPYRVDTVVQIPVDPTEAPTDASEETEIKEETAAPSEEIPETAAPTEGKSSSSSGKTSSDSGKTSSSSGKNSGSSKPEKPQETKPAATQPPTEAATQPPAESPTEALPEPAYDPSSYSVGSLEYAILDAINTYRAEEGLAPLTMSTKLSGIAALRAGEIQQVWSHTRPDGRSYTSALSDYGYGYGAVTENLIYASGATGQQIVDKWMEKDNRSSLLSAEYTTAGIGIYTVAGVTYIANILVG